MRKRLFEQQLRKHADRATPDVREAIRSNPRYQAHIEATRAQRRSLPRRLFGSPKFAVGSMLFAVVLLVVFLAPSPEEERVAASAYFEFNPAIRIDLDEDDRFLGQEGINDDGEAFLDELGPLEDESIEAVIEILLDHAVETGRLSEKNPYLLYDVTGEDDERLDELSRQLEERIPEHVGDRIPDFAMMRGNQHAASDEEREDARHHGIGVMRLRMIETLKDAGAEQSFEELKELSVGELRKLLEDHGIDERPGPPGDMPGGHGP